MNDDAITALEEAIAAQGQPPKSPTPSPRPSVQPKLTASSTADQAASHVQAPVIQVPPF